MQVNLVRPFQIGTMNTPLLNWQTQSRPRDRYTEHQDGLELVREALSHNPSDIHINSGHPVILEINGTMHRLTEHELEWAEFENIARIVRDKEGATSVLSDGKDYDGAFVVTEGDRSKIRRRLRVNMTGTNSIRSTQSGSIVMRPLMDVPPTIDAIGLPAELVDQCYPRRGGVYVVGPTGSGKTSTFASLVAHAARSGAYYHGHWRCYEAPPEYDLEALSSQHIMITQVEIGGNWGLKTFADAVRNAMRAHPVAILLGEVRDYETVSAVVEAALTGHPVFGTIHADNPATAFQRLITRYPVEQMAAAMNDLIVTTEVIIAQRLIKRLDGTGRVAIREWLVFDDTVRRNLLTLKTAAEVSVAIMDLVQSRGRSFRASAQLLVEEGTICQSEVDKVLGK